MINSAEFVLNKFNDEYLASLQDAYNLLALGMRVTTKTALLPVRFLYTLATQRIGRNDTAESWYQQQGGAATELAHAAVGWRHHGINDPDRAEALLSAPWCRCTWSSSTPTSMPRQRSADRTLPKTCSSVGNTSWQPRDQWLANHSLLRTHQNGSAMTRL